MKKELELLLKKLIHTTSDTTGEDVFTDGDQFEGTFRSVDKLRRFEKGQEIMCNAELTCFDILPLGSFIENDAGKRFQIKWRDLVNEMTNFYLLQEKKKVT